MKTLLVFTAVMTLVRAAHAQSFKETVSWMHRLSTYSALAHDRDLDLTEVPLENTCRNFVVIHRHTGKYTDVFTVTLDLAALDPTQIKAQHVKGKPWAYLNIDTRNHEKNIRIQSTVNGKAETGQNTAGVVLKFSSDYAPRFSKALCHAVELCGH